MLKKLYAIILSIGAVSLLAGAPVQAQGFLSGLFGGGGGGGGGSTGQSKCHILSCEEQGVSAIGGLITTAVIVMSVLIGVVAVGTLAYAGLMYASAGDNKEKTAEAIRLIRMVIIGLIMYALTFAIISWLLPSEVITGGEATTTESPTTSPTTSPTNTPVTTMTP